MPGYYKPAKRKQLVLIIKLTQITSIHIESTAWHWEANIGSRFGLLALFDFGEQSSPPLRWWLQWSPVSCPAALGQRQGVVMLRVRTSSLLSLVHLRGPWAHLGYCMFLSFELSCSGEGLPSTWLPSSSLACAETWSSFDGASCLGRGWWPFLCCSQRERDEWEAIRT